MRLATRFARLHGQAARPVHLPELRRGHHALGGQVRACGEWNTHRRGRHGAAASVAGPAATRPRAQGPRRSRSTRCPARSRTRRASPSGIAELDRVTGGGFVRGSALLVGGDPGIGKSTLLMQAAAALADARATASSTSRARRRSRRSGCAPQRLGARPTRRCELAAETNVEDILATLRRRPAARPRRSSIRSRRCGPTRSNRRPAR